MREKSSETTGKLEEVKNASSMELAIKTSLVKRLEEELEK
jgi:hypothetical protein